MIRGYIPKITFTDTTPLMDESDQTRHLRLWPPRDFPLFAVTFAAFVAAAIYAYITYRQLNGTATP